MSERPALTIERVVWGEIVVPALGTFKDVKLGPGGGRAWDWNETGTRHAPGIQASDVVELIDRGSEVIVLSRGMDLVLQTRPETLAFLAERGVRVKVLETRAAVAHVNELARSERVGGLFHSTC